MRKRKKFLTSARCLPLRTYAACEAVRSAFAGSEGLQQIDSMSPLRVCHVVPDLHRMRGYERQALALAGYQRQRQGLETVLVTHAHGSLPEVQLCEAGEVHRVSRSWRGHYPGAFWSGRAGGFDLVHVHALHRLAGYFVDWARRAAIPTLVKVATQTDIAYFAGQEPKRSIFSSFEPRARLRRRLDRAGYRRIAHADVFLALNSGIAQELDALGLPHVRSANGVDDSHFRPPSVSERQQARRALGVADAELCIAFVGRVAASKNIECLVRAMARIATGSVPARLLIAGDGPVHHRLRERISELRVSDRVAILGDLADVRTVLWASDAYASASRREGMPNAVLEAWSCGLPTLLSDIPGHQMGKPEFCKLFPAEDVSRLAGLLEQCIETRAALARRGAAAREHVLRNFTLSQVAGATLALYRELRRKRYRASAPLVAQSRSYGSPAETQ